MMRGVRSRPLTWCLLLVLLGPVVGACSFTSKKSASPSSSSSSTAKATSTTSSLTTDATTSAPTGCPDSVVPGNASPPPNQGAALANGRYFVFLHSVDVAGKKVSVDVAQFLSGEAANKAAAEDGQESPPPNDYYIRNSSKALRTLPVAAHATLCMGSSPGDTNTFAVDLKGLDTLVRAYPDDQGALVWISVTDGSVERVEQQYVP
jgi:hypothetical protein